MNPKQKLLSTLFLLAIAVWAVYTFVFVLGIDMSFVGTIEFSMLMLSVMVIWLATTIVYQDFKEKKQKKRLIKCALIFTLMAFVVTVLVVTFQDPIRWITIMLIVHVFFMVSSLGHIGLHDYVKDGDMDIMVGLLLIMFISAITMAAFYLANYYDGPYCDTPGYWFAAAITWAIVMVATLVSMFGESKEEEE